MITDRLKFEVTAKTHPGKVRTNNEDALFASEALGVFAVADGMGGHERGEWASAAIVDSLREVPREGDFDSLLDKVSAAIHTANSVVYAEAQDKHVSMGSTAVALVLKDERFAVMWCGDSRAYVLRDGALHQLSRDHTRVQEMIDRGLLTVEQAVGHPMGHVLSRAVGVGAALELDGVADEPSPGDVFLLCSDGLYGVVSDAEIAGVLATSAVSDAANNLIDLCLARGAPDNVTVVLVRVSEATVLSFAGQA